MHQTNFNSHLSMIQHSRQRSHDSQPIRNGFLNQSHRSVSHSSNMHLSKVPNSCSSAASQLNGDQMRVLFDEYQDNSMQNSSSNRQFKAINQVYNDDGTNIYTEPTIIDHNADEPLSSVSGMIGNTMMSGPPLPPPPPPPIFTYPVITSTTTTFSAINEPNLTFSNNSSQTRLNTQNLLGQDSMSNLIHSQEQSNNVTNEPQMAQQSQLTITGQDLAITLNNGEITQTVFNTPQLDPNVDNVPSNSQLFYYYSAQRVEFLPLCDLLFNIISLAAYFCDVVFDSVTAYTLYLNGQTLWLIVALVLILSSGTISQVLSYLWYKRDRKLEQQYWQLQMEQQQAINSSNENRNNHSQLLNYHLFPKSSSKTMALIHVFFCGVLWRYFKLFAPVNLVTVKREVRDLCVLRMVHAFCEAGPMLLLQMFLLWNKPFHLITDLNIISIFLSLFSISWALSSFSKNIRHSKIHKLVLTWLGVIFQFFWRMGTITSRIVALTIYASLYDQWLFAVLFLHWFSMFLWLLSPGITMVNLPDQINPMPENKPSRKERIVNSALLAWVYIFCFINFEDSNPRHRMTAFYCTMFLENILLLSISIFFDNRSTMPWYRALSLSLVIGSFLIGMFFMWIYYHFFHIRHLKHSLEHNDFDGNNIAQPTNISYCENEQNQNNIDNESFSNYLPQNSKIDDNIESFDSKLSPVSKLVNAFSKQCFPSSVFFNSANSCGIPAVGSRDRHVFRNDNIPGVFNCRLNPALKRKKKKPSTVPPPPQQHGIRKTHEMNKASTSIVARRTPLETIKESVSIENEKPNSEALLNPGIVDSRMQTRRSLLLQAQRPHTNASILARRQPSADTFWRKSNLSARSLSISPSAMLKADNTFRLPAKHPFSSTITTPTSPINFLTTENFTDKLEFVSDSNKSNSNINSNKEIIRPKPIVQQPLGLDEHMFQHDELFNQKRAHNDCDRELKQNGSLFHYYYHPYYRKVKLRSQTPEVLLAPHADNSCVYYDYPSSVVAIQPNMNNSVQNVLFSKEKAFINGFTEYMPPQDKMVNGDEMFLQQCQRPPVPGREGGDKSEENDNDNSSYVEGKRSLINYGMNKERLEKILEKKKEQNEEESTKTQNSRTLPNDGKAKSKSKSKRNKTVCKKKPNTIKNKSRLKARAKFRSISLQSVGSVDSSTKFSSSSTNSPSSMSSSGDDGDIESDINQCERKMGKQYNSTRAYSTSTMTKSKDYKPHGKQVKMDEYDEAFGSGDGFDDSIGDSNGKKNPCSQLNEDGLRTSTCNKIETFEAVTHVPKIIRGSISQLQASRDQPNSLSTGQQIANYHFGSSLTEQKKGCPMRNQIRNTHQLLNKSRPLYHSAKYKRHNTPL